MSGLLVGGGLTGSVRADGTGSSAATGADINVLDRGVVGDGNADDTAAIQVVLDEAPAGATVVFPGGHTFRCTSGLRVDKQLLLRGSGHLTFTGGMDEDGHPAGLTLTGDGTAVRDLTLVNPDEMRGDPTFKAGGSNYGIKIAANDVSIMGCTVDRFQSGIVVEATGEFVGTAVIGNRIKDVLGRGGGPEDTETKLGEDSGDGITVWGAQAVVASNVINAKAGADARIGIHFEALADRQEAETAVLHSNQQMTVTGNVVYGQFRRGIVVERAAFATISGNSVADATWWGIALIDANNCTVVGNSILWTRTAGDDHGGSWSPMRAPLCAYGSVTDSIFASNTLHAQGGSSARAFITVQANADPDRTPTNVVVQGNRLSAESDADVQTGVVVYPRASRLRLLDNSVAGFSATGIDLRGADRFEVRGNAVDGRGREPEFGVDARSAGESGGVIADNTISDVGTAIARHNGTGSMICGNVIDGCATGIDGQSSAGTLVANNVVTVSGDKLSRILDGQDGNVVTNNL